MNIIQTFYGILLGMSMQLFILNQFQTQQKVFQQSVKKIKEEMYETVKKEFR